MDARPASLGGWGVGAREWGDEERWGERAGAQGEEVGGMSE